MRERAELVARAARRAAAESRQLLRELRRDADGLPPAPATATPLTVELRSRVQEFVARTGTAARFVTEPADGRPDSGAESDATESGGAESDAGDAVPRALARAVGSVVDEALENVHRHAGARGGAVVTLGGPAAARWVTVTDDGRGLPPGCTPATLRDGGHFGVVGMAERAAAAGAGFRIGPARPHGTEVRLDLPAVGEAAG